MLLQIQQMMRFAIDTFTPEDDEETDNERHKPIRAQIKEPIKTEDDKLFNQKK
jgi:hypothetical protein